MAEKRKYQRISGKLPVKLALCGNDIVTETKNISGSGAYCSVSKALEPMTKLGIVLLVPSKRAKNESVIVKTIKCEGVVVRKEYVEDNGKSAYHVGIFFSNIKESDRKILLSYIDSLRSK